VRGKSIGKPFHESFEIQYYTKFYMY